MNEVLSAIQYIWLGVVIMGFLGFWLAGIAWEGEPVFSAVSLIALQVCAVLAYLIGWLLPPYLVKLVIWIVKEVGA